MSFVSCVGGTLSCEQFCAERPPVVTYTPCMWAHTFSNISIDEQVQQKYGETIEALKREARGMLMAATTPLKQMILIDTLERLGLAYHFETEIEETLAKIYNIEGDADLFTTALRFRLLRQHRFHIPCTVFGKFVDKDGKFEETLISSDGEGLLSLYEAAHVRFRDEKILEDAAKFTKHHLSCMVAELESPFKERVKRALEHPLHRDVPIFHARFYISIYEKDYSRDELLLKLAKFNFNFLQNLYKLELRELFRWWNKYDLKSKLPHARDRMVEAYIWSVGYHYEPRYSYVRTGLAKVIQVGTMMDDTYDNYATLDEAQLFTEMLDRWNMDGIDRLPNDMKIVYHFIMSAFEDYERDAVKQGLQLAVPYYKETVRAYIYIFFFLFYPTFLDKDGKFEETLISSDGEGLLSLYEAAHVRFRDEKILEDAAKFTKHHLSCMVAELESPFKERVKRALEHPLHRDVPIFHARFYISIYEKDYSRDELLLKLAKFNFNFLQNLYKLELRELFRWWNKYDLKSKLSHARDRMVQSYIWSVGYHYEPRYSYVRIGLVNVIQVATIMDDTYDNYATLDEARLFTEMLDRWNMDGIDRLPNDMKIVYHFIMSAFEDYERDAAKQGLQLAVPYYKETVQELGRAYNQELKWLMGRKMPSFQDYAKNSEVTSTMYILFAGSILGLTSITQETIDWMKSEPKLATSAAMMGRYINDIASSERENKEGKMMTVLDCYMNQYNLSKKETLSKFAESYEEKWMEVNEEWVATSFVPKEATIQILNYARLCDVCYNKSNADGFTDPKVFAAHVAAIFIDPIVI